MPQDTRRDFPHFAHIPTRWMDNDVYGHVNNVVYYSYFDTVINRWLIAEGGLDIKKGAIVGLCVESKCRFLRDDRLSRGHRRRAARREARLVERAIRASASSGAASEELCAMGYFVHVFVDRDMKPATIPPEMRKVMERLVRR